MHVRTLYHHKWYVHVYLEVWYVHVYPMVLASSYCHAGSTYVHVYCNIAIW
jgi:hypothetical protein